MGAFTFLLTVAFVPFLPAGALTPRFALLSIGLPIFMLWRRVPLPHVAVLAYVAFYVWLAPSLDSALFDAWTFLLWVAAFMIGRTTDLRPVFIGAAWGLAVNSVVMLLPLDLPHTTLWAGLFTNRNGAVEAAAMVAAAIVAYRLWWLLPGLAPTLLAGARAPILALGLVGAAALWRRSRLQALAGALAALAIFALLFWRRDVQALDPFGTLHERLDVWRDLIPNLNVLGHGFGAFTFDYPTMQDHTDALAIRYDHPHADILQIAYELGVGGVLLVGVLCARLGRVAPDPAWYALVVFLLEGCAGFPLYTPLTGFLAALCAGHLYGPGVLLRHRVAGLGLGVRGGHTDFLHRPLPACRGELPY